MTRLKAAIVGYGVMGRNHARVLSSLEGVELTGVFDPYLQNVSPAIGTLYSSLEQLADSQVDYCVISVPTELHEEVSISLMQAGINLLIEKPISHNVESAIRMYESSRKHNVVAAVGHIERYNSALIQARMRIEQGQLGSIYMISSRRQGPFPGRIKDVGVVKDLATHDIDLTSWVAGSHYKVVSAFAGHRAGREFEDLVSINALLKSNVMVNHIVNWLSPTKDRHVAILGEKGMLTVDTLHAELNFFENGKFDISQTQLSLFHGVTQGDAYSYSFEKPEPLKVEHENFRDAILGKPSNVVSLEEGLDTLKVAEAVIRSYETSESQFL